MQAANSFKERIFSVSSTHVDQLAIEVFHYQSQYNPIYNLYLKTLGVDIEQILSVNQIPFLPISFFKDAKVKTGTWAEEKIFESSGTTQQIVKSQHLVKDIGFYDKVCIKIFEQTYGRIDNCHILGLLPSYLERDGSSLVHMVDMLINKSNSAHSGFYLYNHEALYEKLILLSRLQDGKRIILFGVTFALLDFAAAYTMNLENLIVIETGGMKGRKEEMTRAEVHDFLKRKLGVTSIHSEYGMTELLSQAYSLGEGKYLAPTWMRISTRDINDPFADSGKRLGIIKVMDLANADTCAFIETQDIGLINSDGTFEVLGRADNSEMRGCSLMAL